MTLNQIDFIKGIHSDYIDNDSHCSGRMLTYAALCLQDVSNYR